MAKVFLICGKICSGKTTYAKRLMAENNAILLSVDEITLALFGQHIGEKHDEICERTQNYLFEKALEILAAGMDVIFDWGFWTNEERQSTTEFFKEKEIPVEWHYIDVRDDVWRQNLNKRNKLIMDGQENFYFIDDNIAVKFERLFEIPKHDEIDVWYENKRDKKCDENTGTNISIRPVQVSDYPVIESLLSQITQVHYIVRPDIFRPAYKKVTDDSAADFQDADAPVFVAVSENNCIVGCLWCVIKRERNNSLKIDRDWLVIDDICVDEKYRGTGIGKKLVEFASQLAQEKGLGKIELNVYQDNRTAVQFYKHLGFNTQKRIMELDVPVFHETPEARRARIYPVILSEYNPSWPEWYVEEKTNLERLLGDYIVRIQHIGSTAVPGLMAKPTVDILLEVPIGTNFDDIVAVFSSHDEYICLYPPTNPEPLCVIKGYTSTGFAEKVFHVHVREASDYDEPVFRDYLITHPEAAAEYADLKRKLFRDYEHDRDGYTEAKGEFVRMTIEKAQKEGNGHENQRTIL